MLWSYENPSVSDGVQRAAIETGLDDISRYTLRRTLIAGDPMRAVLQDLDILTRRQQALRMPTIKSRTGRVAVQLIEPRAPPAAQLPRSLRCRSRH
jgi:hypothetical protein